MGNIEHSIAMDNIERCDSCEQSIRGGDGYYSAPHAATFCAPCCGAILSAENERLSTTNRGAVEALRLAEASLRDLLGWIPADQPEHHRVGHALDAIDRSIGGQ